MAYIVSDFDALERVGCLHRFFFFFTLQIKLTFPNKKENIVSRYL